MPGILSPRPVEALGFVRKTKRSCGKVSVSQITASIGDMQRRDPEMISWLQPSSFICRRRVIAPKFDLSFIVPLLLQHMAFFMAF